MVDKTMPIESRETLIQLRGTNEFNFDNADTYLGDFDAASEWNNDIENARKSFLHISSYEQFLDESKLILLGRTGTGKTSILRCFEHDVKTRAGNLRYDYVINYDFSEMLSKIVDYENIISAPQVSIKLVESFEVMINTIVMHTLYNQYGQTHLEKVKKYLTEQGLIHIRGFSSIVRLFFQAAEDMKGTFGEYASSVASVYNFISKATSVSYYEALEELYAALQNKKFLILIDTLNEYNFEKAETITIIKALISLCFKYYNNRQNGIYTKIALPSEVYRRLITKVPGKQQGNTVTIQWTTKQLICFIALRLYAWCQRQNAPMFAFWRTFAYDDFYGASEKATENARRFIHHFLPPVCPTSLNYSFDTLAYCVRHTLKKPREFMMIFNAFLHVILQEGDLAYFYNHPHDIAKVIHSTQDAMIKDALSMYSVTHNNLDRASAKVLENLDYLFRGSDIKDRLKGIRRLTRGTRKNAEQEYGKEELMRVLFESGMVGVVQGEHIIPGGTQGINNPHPVRVLTASFEYQQKGMISLDDNKLYVIHPMCYEYYNCWINPNTLVHPDKIDKEDAIYFILHGQNATEE